jgi:hypothetical protein
VGRLGKIDAPLEKILAVALAQLLDPERLPGFVRIEYDQPIVEPCSFGKRA